MLLFWKKGAWVRFKVGTSGLATADWRLHGLSEYRATPRDKLSGGFSFPINSRCPNCNQSQGVLSSYRESCHLTWAPSPPPSLYLQVIITFSYILVANRFIRSCSMSGGNFAAIPIITFHVIHVILSVLSVSGSHSAVSC